MLSKRQQFKLLFTNLGNYSLLWCWRWRASGLSSMRIFEAMSFAPTYTVPAVAAYSPISLLLKICNNLNENNDPMYRQQMQQQNTYQVIAKDTAASDANEKNTNPVRKLAWKDWMRL